MGLIDLGEYTPKALVNVQAMLDDDGSNMSALFDWVQSLGGNNSATFDPNMYVLSIFTLKDGVMHMFNYNPGYYLVLTPSGELTQVTQNTFELLYQTVL